MTDRSVLVTGGTGGLGAPVTEAFLADGWRVVVPVHHPDGGKVSAGAVAVPGVDLTEPAGVQATIEAAVADPGAPLRAVVNLVGGYAGGSKVDQMPIADFERQFTLNVRPTYLVTQAALPHLVAAGGGGIVCVSSRAAVSPFPKAAGYIAAKAAVLAFAQAVAAEYRDAGIRCNALLPSIIDTPANRAAQPGADYSRWVAPAEIAAVIRFLVSDDGTGVNGAAIPL